MQAAGKNGTNGQAKPIKKRKEEGSNQSWSYGFEKIHVNIYTF